MKEMDTRWDLEQGRSREMVNFEVLREVANNIYKFLHFKGEPAEDEKGIPCLDTQVLVGSGGAMGQWYEGDPRPGELIPGAENTRTQVMSKF